MSEAEYVSCSQTRCISGERKREADRQGSMGTPFALGIRKKCLLRPFKPVPRCYFEYFKSERNAVIGLHREDKNRELHSQS